MLDVAGMISTLELDGIHTDEKTVCGILDMGEESFHLLARLATDDECWNDLDGDWLVPICAIHLLAKMKHYRAHLAINTAIMGHYEETGDWLTEDMPYVLAHMGVGAIPAMAALMRYDGADMFVRGSAAEALIMIAMDNLEAKPGIVASIKDAARNEADIETRTVLVNVLLDLKDPDLYGYLKDSLERGFILDDHFDLDYLDGAYAGVYNLSSRDPRDPLYIFSYHDENPYKHAGRGGYLAKSHAVRKVGRNERCPCGSGKKYKKCWMSCSRRDAGNRGRLLFSRPQVSATMRDFGRIWGSGHMIT